MRTREWWFWVAPLWIASTVAGVAWGLISAPEDTPYQIYAEKAQQQAAHIADQLRSLFVSIIGWPGSLTADGWIAFATLLLVAIAYRQIQTSRAQLRAYVWISQSQITDILAEGLIDAVLMMTNSGQTPANEVTQWAKLAFGNYPLRQVLPGPDAAIYSKSHIGPGGSFMVRAHGNALSPIQKDAIRARTHAVYIYGEIRYRTLRKKRFTRFCFFKGGDMGTDGPSIHAYPEGNEAN
jgi:hypothetical protein